MVGVIDMDSVSPHIERSGRGSAVDRVPHKACAKDGFADCTDATIRAGATICVETAVASLLLQDGVAARLEGGASSACQSNMIRQLPSS